MSSKRASVLPPAPKGPRPPITFSPGIVVADNASFLGTQPIVVGENTVIHPRAKLFSLAGPVTIGSTCIISERAVIGTEKPVPGTAGVAVGIGNGVVVEVGAVVEAKEIGDGCLIEVNARVGKNAVLGKHCKIGPKCIVQDNEVLPDYTVIYGPNLRRRDNSGVDELKMKMISKQIDVLRKLIPSNPNKHL